MKVASSLSLLPALPISGLAAPQNEAEKSIYDEFPSQEPRLVREMVGVSHGNVDRVRELLEMSPALAKATWDWGFGDWETALGAASHVGNRDIAILLIRNGARPDLFTFAMLGQLEVVIAYISANPGVQRLHGPHGLTLMHHARAGGEESKPVVDYLERVGGADIGQTSKPLSDKEKQAYIGRYSFGVSEGEKLLVSLDKKGTLVIQRLPEGTNRALMYLGNHEFHPTGAAAVRIRFEMNGDLAARVSITDGKLHLAGARFEG